MSRQGVLWILAGVAGITLAAGITWATSQLTSQHIGLSSEPVSAARGLAPHATEAAPRARTPLSTIRRRHAPLAPGTTATQPTLATPTGSTPPTTGATPSSPTPAPAEPRPTGGGEGSSGSRQAPGTRTGGRTSQPEGGHGDDGSAPRERPAGHERDD